MTQGTRSGYASDWKAWVSFIRKLSSQVEGDVYLDQVKSDTDKATILALFFKERYEDGGLRARQATSISAGIRHQAPLPRGTEISRLVRVANSNERPSCLQDELR